MITNILILLLFLAPTVQYRVEVGSFSFALMEPITLLISTALLTWQIIARRRLVLVNDTLIFLCLGMVLWAMLIRPLDADWKHGLSDIRDWAIPVLGYAALTSSIRQGWRRWSLLLLVAVFLQALLGIYQHFADTARLFVAESAAYKTGFEVSPETSQLALVSFAVGMFSHPNGYAIYLFIGLMIALGRSASGRLRWLKIAMIIPIVLALFWAYAKASLLVMAFAVLLFFVQRSLKSNRVFLITIGAGLLAGVCALAVASRLVPDALLETLYWRFGLWRAALELIGRQPTILLFGNGMGDFAQHAYYGQPHNVYLFLLLQYGLLGLCWVVLVLVSILHRGWYARRHGWMRREPLLAAYWLALLGFFLIGMVESTLLDIESRMLFLLVAACFSGLAREIKATSVSMPAREIGYAGTAVAYSRLI
jgi:O-antigen ligase